MLVRALKFIGTAALLASPVAAQFGVGGGNRKAATFEEQREQAQQQMAGMGGDMMDQLANLDPGEMMKMLQESMNDPATMDYLNQFGEGMQDVMDQLSQMSPDQLMANLQENLAQMSSPDILDSVLEQKDEVLSSLLEQGLITPEQAADYESNPEKFQQEMASAFDQMNELLSDPKALEAAMGMMTGMSDLLNNPEGAMGQMADAFNDALGDDEKIEEARLQLLADPGAAGNPALASLFQSEDMLDILSDPIKFRDEVKKGKEMLSGLGGGAGGFGAGIGEL